MSFDFEKSKIDCNWKFLFFYYRHVGSDRSGGTSDRSVMLLNLCASLFAGYLIFIAGVSKTENKVYLLIPYLYSNCIFVRGPHLILTAFLYQFKYLCFKKYQICW